MTYVSPVARHSRVLPHVYFNASDDLAAHEADQEGLQAVTAALMTDEAMADVDFFLFSASGASYGNAWTRCDGVDPMVNGKAVDIWTVAGSCREMQSPDTRVFVRASVLREKGYEMPKPARGSRQGHHDAVLQMRADQRRWRHRIDEVPAVGREIVWRRQGSEAENTAKVVACSKSSLWRGIGDDVRLEVDGKLLVPSRHMEYWRYA